MRVLAQLGKGLGECNSDTWMLGGREIQRVVIGGGVWLSMSTSGSEKDTPKTGQV